MSLEKMTTSNTAALLGGLVRQVKIIETDPGFANSARESVAMLMGELCKRYEIKLTLYIAQSKSDQQIANALAARGLAELTRIEAC